MLRVLFIILAVVAISLAIVLQQPLLYLVAVALLLGAGGLLTLKLKKRHSDIPETYMQAPPEQMEELSSLGILDIRPRAGEDEVQAERPPRQQAPPGQASPEQFPPGQASPEQFPPGQASPEQFPPGQASPEQLPPGKVSPVQVQTEFEMESVAVDSSSLDLGVFDDVDDTEEERSEATGVTAELEGAPARPGDVRSPVLGRVRTRKPRARVMVSEASADQNADVLIPALRSLRAGLDAYTVCLMRQVKSPLRYHIEAIVSQNSYARSQGSFAAKEPLLAGHKALVPVVFPKVGAEGFPKSKLGYYHEPISVRQVAMGPVMPKKGSEPVLLGVDTTNDRRR